MDKLILTATDVTPQITFDHLEGKFDIIGESCMENASKFYSTLFSWIEEYKTHLYFINDYNKNKKKIVFTFHLSYVSSSSLKCTYDLLQKIEELKPFCESINIKWLYDKDDLDMEDNGNEFSTMVDIPFSILEVV
ncbi:MAG TPA: DUF1987 domain-containing protein [Bacteroidia bacterium]|jgi:hypothetical protein|nr:DUF1987 domain-containing protein [Bacteroidia bacterium]